MAQNGKDGTDHQINNLKGRGRGRGMLRMMANRERERQMSPNYMQSNGQQKGGGDLQTESESQRIDNRYNGSGDHCNSAQDIRQSCETAIDRSSKVNKFAKGSDGKAVDVIANHYCLKVESNQCYRYDVEINLSQDEQNDSNSGAIAVFRERKMRKLAQKENIHVIESLVKEWDLFKDINLAFDGKKCILTGEKLSLNGQQVSHNITVKVDGYKSQTYEVLIQFTNEVNMSLLNDFYEGRLNAKNYEEFHEVLQVLEIILKYIPSQTHIPVGKCLYSRDRQTSIGDNAMMAYGHYQSVNITEVGPTLVVDRYATLFRSSGPLIDFIAEIIGVKSDRLQRLPFDEKLIPKITRQISGLRIFTTHVNNSKRIDTCDRMTASKANVVHFERDKKDGSGKERITIQNYFFTEYGIKLDNVDIPLILLKGSFSRFLPVEVCNVCPEQPMPKRLITSDMRKIIVKNSNSMKPIDRFGLIQESLETIANQSRDLLKSFGLQLIEKQIQIKARELKAPKLEGDFKEVIEGADLRNWCFINVSPNRKNNLSSGRTFVDKMVDIGVKMGINIERPVVLSGPCDDSKTVDLIYAKVNKVCPNVELIVFCIPSDGKHDDEDESDEDIDGDETTNDFVSDMYNDIKYYGDIKYGIITQCIHDDKVVETPDGYLTNLLLKINAKLNGRNVVLSPDSRLPVMKTSLMIVGVDVTHPSTGSETRIGSSIAALVGSYDENYIKYRTVVRVEPQNRQELIENFNEMMIDLLENFRYFNNKYPQSIVIFRDGVSEGEFDQVLTKELCEQLIPKYEPKTTVMVVVKRHQTRLIPFKEGVDERTGKPNLNLNSGTVVDQSIVNPIHREFFLYSQKGMLGTSRPTKYVVLRDDNNMTADEIQKLCYYLCFISNRTTKSISMPTPVSNAHLAAFRAKAHILSKSPRTGRIDANESQQQREEREAKFIKEQNDLIVVKELLKNKPYYC